MPGSQQTLHTVKAGGALCGTSKLPPTVVYKCSQRMSSLRLPRRPMGFGLRGLEIALTNRTARGWNGAGWASSGRTCAAGVTAATLLRARGWRPLPGVPGRVPGQRTSSQGRFSGTPVSLLM